jgi:hypothetical protein
MIVLLFGYLLAPKVQPIKERVLYQKNTHLRHVR